MLFRPALFLMAGLAFAGSGYLWLTTPPTPEVVFSAQEGRQAMSGKAVRSITARGGEQVRLELDGGGVGHTDCLAMPFVCADERRAIFAVAGEVLPLEHGVLWPVSVVRQGRAELSVSESRLAYERYYERESTRYRLPFAIAVALLALARWIGRHTEND